MTVPLRAGVLIAEDHRLVRDGLRMVIDAAPDLEVVVQANDGVEAVERARSTRACTSRCSTSPCRAGRGSRRRVSCTGAGRIYGS